MQKKETATIHKQVFELLPWWVNQTLDQKDHSLVERHIAHCESCQQEIEYLATVNQNITTEAETVYRQHADPAQDLQRVMSMIDKERSANKSDTTSQLMASIKAWFSAPSAMHWTATAIATVTIVFLGVKFLNTTPDTDNPYRVLSSDAEKPAAMQLVMHTEVTEEALWQLIKTTTALPLEALTLTRIDNQRVQLGINTDISLDTLTKIITDLTQSDDIDQVEFTP